MARTDPNGNMLRGCCGRNFINEIYLEMRCCVANEYQFVKSDIIPYPVLFSLFTHRWKLGRESAKAILHEMSDMKLIRIIAGHGISFVSERRGMKMKL